MKLWLSIYLKEHIDVIDSLSGNKCVTLDCGATFRFMVLFSLLVVVSYHRYGDKRLAVTPRYRRFYIDLDRPSHHVVIECWTLPGSITMVER